MSSYNQDFRDIVIKKYKSGFTAEALRDFFNIDIRTVSSWIAFYEATGEYSSKQPQFEDKSFINKALQSFFELK